MPRGSRRESSRQFIVRAIDAKSGALFVQNGIRPQLYLLRGDQRGGTALIG